MKLFNKATKSETAQRIAAYAIAGLLWVLYLTMRWRRHMPEETRGLLEAGKPVVLCLWHGRMLLLAGGWRRPPKRKRIGVLASSHRDGRLIGNCVIALGYEAVFGSSNRHGVSALRGVTRLIEQGVTMAVTPDGPRGPRMRFKPGPIKIAQITGAPLVAVSGSSRPRRIFDTWDRFCLPIPFSRGELHFGPPVYVPRDADAATVERCRQEVEERLNALTNLAERDLAQEEIRPAAPEETAGKAGRRHARA